MAKPPKRRIRSVCVYCGSSGRGPARHRRDAVAFGRALAAARIELVYGGGHVGLMGLMADAALSAGGRVIGVIPADLIKKEVGYGKVTRLVVTKSMHSRKMAMFKRSDAFVVLPGGPGTLDEFFEVLTWRQLRFHDKPIVLVESHGYWTPLIDLIEWIIRHGYARASFRNLFKIVRTVDDVLPALRAAPRPRVKSQPKRL
ncbi:MAG: TIGR00730 family Rossman fold protein [Alphaproteobacteria bacterium]|nr:TIGR00730 family Rossman fold protein [Alphaproteobacteria bacterium]